MVGEDMIEELYDDSLACLFSSSHKCPEITQSSWVAMPMPQSALLPALMRQNSLACMDYQSKRMATANSTLPSNLLQTHGLKSMATCFEHC
jgi:hypothetical protein